MHNLGLAELNARIGNIPTAQMLLALPGNAKTDASCAVISMQTVSDSGGFFFR